MTATAKKSDPKLWEKVKKDVTKGDKGGKPGQWSARKAQLAVHEYKEEGGGYKGGKAEGNSLHQWTKEDWGTKSGQKSGETGERYLPKKKREGLSDAEYDRTTRKKRADTKQGRQVSRQPKDIAAKTGKAGPRGETREALLAKARERNIPGRSRMRKPELVAALSGG